MYGILLWFCMNCIIPKEVDGARQIPLGKREERNVGASLGAPSDRLDVLIHIHD